MRRCCMCKMEKPETEFAFQSLATGKRQDHCRACHAAYRRQHYLDNRALYIAREVARMKGYRLENRAHIWQYLMSHPCVDCGATDPLVLELDHRDRDDKRSEVARLATTKPWKTVAAEIAKCDVRCGNCHRRRTSHQFGWADGTSPSQGVEPARRRIVEFDPSASLRLPMDGSGSQRQCTRCLEEKPLTEFSVRSWKTGTRVRRCHACIAAASRAHYWKDPRCTWRRPGEQTAKSSPQPSEQVSAPRLAEMYRLRRGRSCGAGVRPSRSEAQVGERVADGGEEHLEHCPRGDRQVRNPLRQLPPASDSHSVRMDEARTARRRARMTAARE